VTDKLVSIVLPVHNQEDHISDIVRAYEAALNAVPIDHELILVTNACQDNSIAVCRGLCSEFGSVQTCDTDRGGWGRAVKMGLQKAGGDILCYTNSARTSAEILTLTILYARAHPNVVIKANRKIRDNWRRRLGSLLYNLECRAFFDLPVWDVNGTPKVFPRSFGKLLQLRRDDDLIDAEFNVVCRQEDYPILEVPVISTRRHGGKSTTNYASGIRMYWGAYDLWRKMRQASNHD
jgi:glycosyltransferase involved in cell wall biosynthesis